MMSNVRMILFFVFFISAASATSSISQLSESTRSTADKFINEWINDINETHTTETANRRPNFNYQKAIQTYQYQTARALKGKKNTIANEMREIEQRKINEGAETSKCENKLEKEYILVNEKTEHCISASKEFMNKFKTFEKLFDATEVRNKVQNLITQCTENSDGAETFNCILKAEAESAINIAQVDLDIKVIAKELLILDNAQKGENCNFIDSFDESSKRILEAYKVCINALTPSGNSKVDS